jgi:hypothetical protein
MGEILGLGMSHFPGMRRTLEGAPGPNNGMRRPDVPDEWKDRANWPPKMLEQLADDQGAAHAQWHHNKFIENCRKLRQRLDEFNPDFVLVWGDDQYENFKEDIVPAFCVLAYDDLDIHPYVPEGDRLDPKRLTSTIGRQQGERLPPNPWNETEETVITVKGKREAAKYLAKGLIENKIDVGYSYEPLHHAGLAHAFLNTVMFLDWDRKGFDYPVVSMQVNCYGSHVIANRGGPYPIGKIDMTEAEIDPPGPTPERCMEVGAATVRVLKESPWRVAVIASSSWSHAFLTPKHHLLYPDVAADRAMFEMLRAGDYEAWRRTPLAQMEDCGQQEMLNWMCLAGAMAELGRKPDESDFLETYIFNAPKCFAIFRP